MASEGSHYDGASTRSGQTGIEGNESAKKEPPTPFAGPETFCGLGELEELCHGTL